MKLKACWTVIDTCDSTSSKHMETDVYDAAEAFWLLRSIANLEPHKGPDWVMWIGSIGGELYDDKGVHIASVPTMWGSYYRARGSIGKSMNNAANWPGN